MSEDINSAYARTYFIVFVYLCCFFFKFSNYFGPGFHFCSSLAQ